MLEAFEWADCIEAFDDAEHMEKFDLMECIETSPSVSSFSPVDAQNPSLSLDWALLSLDEDAAST